MGTEFNGERLRLVRIINNLSSPELATKLDVTKQAISQFETGKAQPRTETLFKIVQVLGFPASFYFEDSACDISAGVAFCRATTTTARVTKQIQTHRDILKAYIFRFFSEYIQYPSYSKMEELSVQMTDLSPSKAAQRLRELLLLGDRPVQSMVNVLQNLGIVVTTYEEDQGHLDAISHCPKIGHEKFYMTAYNLSGTTAYRLNFTLAHELGHWILGHIDSDEKTQNEMDYNNNENDANEFASEFLLPADAFLRDLYYPTDLSAYWNLKQKWHVSGAMMIRRAYSLGRISYNQYQYLFRLIAKNGWRKAEPGDMVSIPKPTIFPESIALLDNNGKGPIPKASLVQHLNEDCFSGTQEIYEDLLGVKRNFLNPMNNKSKGKLIHFNSNL